MLVLTNCDLPSLKESIQIVVYFVISGCLLKSSRDIKAISYADVTWLSSSIPWQFLKVVSFIPSSFALSFIIWTKASSEPAICSAIATTQSFAETTQIAFNISSTVSVSFVSSHIWEPPIDLAFSEHGICSVYESLPLSICSIIKRMLIIFVTEAGRNFSWLLWEYKTWPVDCSIKIAEPLSRFKELLSSTLIDVLIEEEVSRVAE